MTAPRLLPPIELPRGAPPPPPPAFFEGRHLEQRLSKAVLQHQERLTSVVSSSGIGSGDIDDVVQEAFLILARRLDDVPQKAEGAFLRSTVRRLASDRRRSVWHEIMTRESPFEEWGGAQNERPDDILEQLRQRERVDAAIALLPDDERSVFLLSELEALSRQEVAHLLFLPTGTVASRLARARTRFLDISSNLSMDGPSPSVAETGGVKSLIVGSQRYDTNPWGRDKTRSSFDQQLVQRQSGGRDQVGWHWCWPGFVASGFAYPGVLCGWKPWAGGRPSDQRFPVRVVDAKDLVIDYCVDVRAVGSFNLTFCAWICKSGGWSFAPDVSAMTTEVMVCPDYYSGCVPGGRFVSELHVDGENYEIWHEVGHGKEEKGDDRGWNMLTLRGVGGRKSGALALGALLFELARRGLVESDEYLTSVELGNEVMGGAGTTFVERYDLHL